MDTGRNVLNCTLVRALRTHPASRLVQCSREVAVHLFEELVMKSRLYGVSGAGRIDYARLDR